MRWIADAFRSLSRALSALRRERRADWVTTNIALFTPSTVLTKTSFDSTREFHQANPGRTTSGETASQVKWKLQQ